MSTQVWRIGQLLNSVQSTFIGLLRVWSIPIVLSLSVASGYTTYYGMSFFITDWIALIVTVAVQSIVVICTLELAGTHWRANLPRFLSIGASLLVALVVSVSFSYFKFYEFSQHDHLLDQRQQTFSRQIESYLDALARQKSELIAAQQKRADAVAQEANQAFLGDHPTMPEELRHRVGRGQFWGHYDEIRQREEAKLEKLQQEMTRLDAHIAELRSELQAFSFRGNEVSVYEKVLNRYGTVHTAADALAATYAQAPVPPPTLPSYGEFQRGITPSFAMWEDISWFALACAGMVDFFTVILSYRLESTAPGPLTDEEKELAYAGLRQFSEFTINRNDELEFSLERTELERARRIPDWNRMFTVSFLLNRGYLRKISGKRVEFAPNLYPVIADRMKARRDAELRSTPANDDKLSVAMERKLHG
ncbi:hypothetical protein [Methylococcus sp. EFPC2]|uniref:hypothetical protein n=1 Tax=Methylococcus sp. EFPC2 TaxID=2812648 RepID=UPI001966E55A|nr:hypothetical protein [Methylococcus sp. EFPC2]QSA98029.1 hypothetical protein JWZ97_04190 [Methylococcus sp. EFPC2]